MYKQLALFYFSHGSRIDLKYVTSFEMKNSNRILDKHLEYVMKFLLSFILFKLSFSYTRKY